jgi:molybdate transport system substrate-binding protein
MKRLHFISPFFTFPFGALLSFVLPFTCFVFIFLAKKSWLLAFFLTTNGSVINSSPQKTAELTIAAAANVQFAMEELKTVFEKQKKRSVALIIGSSGKLTAQITQGAPYDVFVSADVEYPKNLIDAGKAQAPVQVYAFGTLVLWTTKKIDLKPGLEVLKDSKIEKIALANPRNAPYGEAAMLVLEKKGLLPAVKAKLIIGESIAQTNQYILSGACDVGITAQSSVLAQPTLGKGSWVPIDTLLYHPIAQGAVVTEYGHQHAPEAAKQFLAFLKSSKAKAILKRNGYILAR